MHTSTSCLTGFESMWYGVTAGTFYAEGNLICYLAVFISSASRYIFTHWHFELERFTRETFLPLLQHAMEKEFSFSQQEIIVTFR